MKILFLGTPEFADVCLRRLIDSHHEIVAVISQPDRPAGRGRVLKPTPVKATAVQHNIPVLQPERIRKADDLEHILAHYPCDVAVVIAYGQLLPRAFLDHPRFGCLNIHASLLPKYRGAAPIQWALVNGEKVTGVTIMQLDEGMDTGPIVRKQEVDVLDDDDAKSLMDMLSVVGASLLLEVLEDLESTQELTLIAQDEEEATYAPLITKADAVVDWTLPASRIICKVRGFMLWPGAVTRLKDKEVKLTAVDAVDPDWVTREFEEEDEVPVPGQIIEALSSRGIVVMTGDGLVLVSRLKFAGKQEMDALSALNGQLLEIDQIFGEY
ncbi:MAG: methionyl-tRNA formyltransferase [Sumerlaeia bacterium]